MYSSIYKYLVFSSLTLEIALTQRPQCTQEYGVTSFPDEQYCDKYHLCVNGTYSYETCANGLVYDKNGNIFKHCNYNWAIDCKNLIYDETPISSPGCLYQYGIYPVGLGCQTTFFKCADGTAYETACHKGLAYDPEKHVCEFPDNVYECANQSESVVGFKCPSPSELPRNAVARRFLPFPRFPNPMDDSSYIVCVNGKPRMNNCGDKFVFDHQTLSCIFRN
ncbi:protein obstructor-E [Lepeophtheirus salmonis]|uniref:protein obstructor-E n=1 Tax=Lepeophtheirus salmonis TaxID=72036 RepID=UPI001AE9C783|nr:protein obstructor-E-like [Lepeophtheirus salmonis]